MGTVRGTTVSVKQWHGRRKLVIISVFENVLGDN